MRITRIYTAAITLVTVASISTNYASAKTDDVRVRNDNNRQFPPMHLRLVKQTVRLNIPQNSKAVTELIIEVPSTVAVSNDIDVLDDQGQKLFINVSASNKQIIIDFPETVTSSTTKLQVNLNKVAQPILGSVSVYHFSAKLVGSDVEIPIGVAQFPTF